jgi:hypothetical protein
VASKRRISSAAVKKKLSTAPAATWDLVTNEPVSLWRTCRIVCPLEDWFS